MSKLFIILLVLSPWCVLAETPTPTPSRPAMPDWSAFKPLLGEWKADGSPQGETGGFSLGTELGGQVLVRRNRADFPAKGERPAAHHEDLMVISVEGGRTVGRYWDNEGHVIDYVIKVEGARTTFVSEGRPGPTFRLTLELTAPDALRIQFDMAPPGAPANFKPYLTGTAHRA